MKNYDGILDAEEILESVMRRRNWTVDLRDALAEKLVLVRNGEALNDQKNDGNGRKAEFDANAKRIRSIMERNPYANAKDVIEETGLNRATVYRHLKDLRTEAEEASSNA